MSVGVELQAGEESARFPVGGGELGELIRRFDWSATSLGPISGWPPALRTATNIVLRSPLPLVMLWGPDGVMIYNDAYSVFAGQRHPWLLGSKVLEGWAEVADFNRRVLEVGLAGGTLSFKDQELTLYRNNRPEQVWMDLNYGPVLGDDGRPAGVLAIVVETTDKVMAELQLRESESRFRHLADNAPVMVWVTEPDGACSFLSRSWYDFTGQQPAEALGYGWLEATHPDDRAEAQRVFVEANQRREPFRLEYRLRRADGVYRWAIDAAVPRLGEHGEFLGYVGSVLDIEDRRQIEEHLRLVINELNHRVKNTLAMMQALAAQSFRNADDLAQAQANFTGRVMALSRANDLLTSERWAGASLEEVVRQSLAIYCEGASDRLEVSGAPVQLSSKTALSLCMALHELATNAVKYGAWSSPQGRVVVRWEVDGPKEARRLRLTWREQGGPPVVPPARRGFGSRLIERGLAAELGGRVELVFEPQGLVCRVDAPLIPDDGDPAP
ncbi:sensor histidine kinase [Phenylobacterium sp.]|uniref:sensor histidine kinase n=1 Tax=Phenylobacterium sp. TaxID=1871053 RepID=UPI0035AE50A5